MKKHSEKKTPNNLASIFHSPGPKKPVLHTSTTLPLPINDDEGSSSSYENDDDETEDSDDDDDDDGDQTEQVDDLPDESDDNTKIFCNCEFQSEIFNFTFNQQCFKICS